MVPHRVALLFVASCLITGCSTSRESIPLPQSAPTALTGPRTCFLLAEVGGPATVRKGGEACSWRLPPASTFKIPHAMIALETGARSGVEERETWDGTKYSFEGWNQDHSLASAMRTSAVWYFQRTATRIGRPAMVDWLAKLRYGNATVGPDLTKFWLDGTLLISSDEQLDFMHRVARRSQHLPVRESVLNAVDGMLVQEPGTIVRGKPMQVSALWDPQVRLYAKTGSGDLGKLEVRWLVGYILGDGNHHTSNGRGWAFVSLVVGPGPLSREAIDLAMRELVEAKILRLRAQ